MGARHGGEQVVEGKLAPEREGSMAVVWGLEELDGAPQLQLQIPTFS